MKDQNIISKTKHSVRGTYNQIFKSLILSTIMLCSMAVTVDAQIYEYAKPTFYVGVAAGANFNYHRGSTQNLTSGFSAPVVFNNGDNVGLYLAPLIEFHSPSGVGFMLQIGYDSKNSKFDQQRTVCNIPADLSTNLNYISVEPSLRLSPFNSGFYIYGGPRFSFNINKSFTYKLGLNPDFPDQLPTPDETGDLGDIRKTMISMQIGMGYDIPLSSQNNSFQTVLSPFVAFQPYFGQSPRTTDTWNISTLRVGAALKFGTGLRNPIPLSNNAELPVTDGIRFSVVSPDNIPDSRRVKEIFPLRNDVFFNEGSTEIPNRYVLLNKNQLTNFREDNLDEYVPKNLSGRSDRGMTVYYNLLNIIGDRLGKTPSANINLVGYSAQGQADGMAMAESVKKYLTDVWSVNSSRITVEGREKLLTQAQLAGGDAKNNKMLHEGERKVTIQSSSTPLLMEFQTGADAKMKPVEFTALQVAPLDSYLTFNVDGARKELSSWRLEVKDESGAIQRFGPYTSDQIRIPGKSIMGSRPKGRYNVSMIGTAKNGSTVRKESIVNMNLWTPPADQTGSRYSVIYDFDESKAINIYEKYLTSTIVPAIPVGGTVYIQGHTDVIGEETYNQTLSLDRANNVRSILSNELKRVGRTDVKFDVHGLGENETYSPFDNTLPEQRAYNRTVIIDIIPKR